MAKIGLTLGVCWLLAIPAFAQVQVVYSPEPIEVSRIVYGDLRGMQTWNVRVCNLSETRVEIDTAHVYIAGRHLGLIGKTRATTVLAERKRDTWQSRAVQYITLGVATSTVGAAAVASQNPSKTNVKIVAVMGLAIPVLIRVSDALKEEIPPGDVTPILDGELTLEPRGCAERVAFSRAFKTAEAYATTLK